MDKLYDLMLAQDEGWVIYAPGCAIQLFDLPIWDS